MFLSLLTRNMSSGSNGDKDGRLAVTEADAKPIGFHIHTYSLRSFEPLLRVYSNASTTGHHFSVAKQRPMPSKQTKLPFGLKMTERKRRSKNKPGPGPESDSATKRLNMSESELESLARGYGLDAGLDSLEGLEPLQKRQKRGGCGKRLSSSTSTSESTSSSKPCDSSSDSGSEDLAEKVYQHPGAKEESRRIRHLVKSHEELMQLRGEVFGRKAPEAPEESESEAEASGQTRDNRVYCQATLGLVAVGMQTHHRLATCRQCNESIAKGSLRFQFSYNRQKFACWLHARCAPAYLKKNSQASLQNSLVFLQREKAKEGVSPEVLEAIERLERELAP